MIKAMIVDDEELARQRVRDLLSDHSDIKIIAEASTSADAIVKIKSEHPDLVFLDIQMPESNGFDVIESIRKEYLPLIIFTTAFDEYAIKAFELHAIDYLLKPFDKRRFASALDHARMIINSKNPEIISEQISSLMASLDEFRKKKNSYLKKFVIKETGKISLVNVDEIIFIEADGNYIKLITSNQNFLVRDTMNKVEAKLNPEIFMRVHRSYIIKIELVKEIKTHFDGEYHITLKNNQIVKTGKAYRSNILKLIELP
ncbi:MAG: response regulator [Ignavibacteriales bacterium]|nr:MAG: response regulator [Ignavibacteriales bacterium]